MIIVFGIPGVTAATLSGSCPAPARNPRYGHSSALSCRSFALCPLFQEPLAEVTGHFRHCPFAANSALKYGSCIYCDLPSRGWNGIMIPPVIAAYRLSAPRGGWSAEVHRSPHSLAFCTVSRRAGGLTASITCCKSGESRRSTGFGAKERGCTGGGAGAGHAVMSRS